MQEGKGMTEDEMVGWHHHMPLSQHERKTLEVVGPNCGKPHLLDLRFFIITMALRNIRISTSLWNRIRASERPRPEAIWVTKGARYVIQTNREKTNEDRDWER